MEKCKMLLKKLTKTDIAAIILLLAAFVYLVTYALTNGTFSDEAFYLTVPMRLINGDGLFTDEWHLSQLSAVLLYLPVRLYMSVTGGTQGIILFFRLLFCLMQLGTGTLLYLTLRKYKATAILISISYMSFFVIGINILSYNTMGIASLLALICTVYRILQKPSAVKLVLAGVLTAAFVLCQPFGAILYFIYFSAVCFFSVRKSMLKSAVTPYLFQFRSFLMTVAGILPVFIFFLYLLFRNSDIETIIKCIPGILTDVEHMRVSEDMGIETFSVFVFLQDMTMCAGTVPLVAVVAIFAVCILIIGKKERLPAFILTSAAFAVFSVIFWYRLAAMRSTTETDDLYFYYFALALPGIVFFCLSQKKNKPVFILFWCTGIMYAILMTISSNMRLHASVNGYFISAAGTLLLAKDVLDELKPDTEKDRLSKITSVIISCTVFAFSILCSAASITAPLVIRMSYNSVKITEGVYAGCYLPSDQALRYKKLSEDVAMIKELTEPDDRIFVLDNFPSVYLEGEFNMGIFSGWFISDQLSYPEIRERFREYYEICPENIPDYIYVPAYKYTSSTGAVSVTPKQHAEFAYRLFEGSGQKLYDGLLIEVTGMKNE